MEAARLTDTRKNEARRPAARTSGAKSGSAHVLLVDDDVSLLRLLGMRLESRGYRVTTAESGAEALRKLAAERPDIVLSDLRMDEMDGLALFQAIQREVPGLPVIILTAHGSIPDAVNATQQGVFSFLTKPVDRDELFSAIDEALTHLPSSNGDDSEAWRASIITRSPEMERVLEQARMVASSDVSVLITGPSGSGKELLARAIHDASPRANNPFVAINCGALPEQLLESELFGHAKGAFTGAVSDHKGLFQAAEGGTLFLDEIGDMPLPLQVKLLRALQERQIRPLGSTQSIPVNVRILSATHRDLSQAMHQGEFREDFFYRLNVVNLKLPALKDRAEDVPLLARHLVAQAAARHKPFVKGFSPEALNLLATSAWPGNVRQLVNVVEQCVALTRSPMIPEALVAQALAAEDCALPTFNDARASFERSYLVKVLKITEGNVTQAARIAGRNRTDFYKLLSRHELEPSTFKPE
nr:two-component system response regulator GlrR [Halomonas lactosivorans]